MCIERFFRENAELIDVTLATLMLGPILLDTVNLSPQHRRVTPRDEAVAQKLIKIAQINHNNFFTELQNAKFSDDSLTTSGLYSLSSFTHPHTQFALWFFRV